MIEGFYGLAGPRKYFLAKISVVSFPHRFTTLISSDKGGTERSRHSGGTPLNWHSEAFCSRRGEIPDLKPLLRGRVIFAFHTVSRR